VSAQATGWVWTSSTHTGSVLLVHLALADVANDAHGNELWMATGTLAAKTRLGRRTVQRALRILTESGDLEVVEEAPGRPVRYRLALDVGCANLAPPGGANMAQGCANLAGGVRQPGALTKKNPKEQPRAVAEKCGCRHSPGSGLIRCDNHAAAYRHHLTENATTTDSVP
jgi:hypothetical protein